MIGALLCMRLNQSEIARCLERPRSTISREIGRNSYSDGAYRAHHAVSKASGRRRRSRHGSHFAPAEWAVVEKLLRADYSPEQVSGHLKLTGRLNISHETIYKHVWEDKRNGGTLHTHLRGAGKRRRKRYGAYDSRGRLAGKRPISDRPEEAENRNRLGDWEIDTVLGSGRACILTLVDRIVQGLADGVAAKGGFEDVVLALTYRSQ